MEILDLQGLYKIYKEGEIETVALRGANLTIQPGEFVAITGRSGAGKSTLLNLIGGLSTPSAGRIIIKGTDISLLNEAQRVEFRRQNIGIIYQADNLIPFLTALENVILPMQLLGRKNASERAKQLLGDVGLANRMKHKPNMLSGGERQRVSLALALANDPDLLLADELTGELDSSNAARVMELLGVLNSNRKLTLVIVTHNKTVASCANRLIKIVDGQLSETEVSHAR
jgi:ABC-type lipoprotein export system ATPase subunit